jgi:hypothetical protein
LPRGFRADRKSWAAIRRRVFDDPPTERRSGRPTSPSSRPPQVGSGGSARSSTTRPNTAWPPPSPRPPAARTPSRASQPLSSMPNTSCSSRTCAPIAAKSTWSTRPPANCCAPSQRGSPSCPTTGRAFAAAYSPNHSPAKTRAAPRPHPSQEPADQRRHRAVLRHPQVRAPLPRTHLRRRRPRRRSQPVPPDRQHHPTPPSPPRPHPRDAYLAGR